MTSRFAFAAALVAVMLTTSGCLPQPEPEPTPRFTSEAEAFAAAEATYRAYVDALNQVDLSDPETFEAVYAWTTGELNASDREGLTAYHADGVSVSGESRIVGLYPARLDESGAVELAVCLDVASIEVVDAQGTSLVAPDRVPVQSLTVSAQPEGSGEYGFLLTNIGPRDSEPSC